MQNNRSYKIPTPSKLREINLFQLSLINYERNCRIRPLYTGFQEFKQSCNRNMSQGKGSQHMFYPIVWIDVKQRKYNNLNQAKYTELNLLNMSHYLENIIINSQYQGKIQSNLKQTPNNSKTIISKDCFVSSKSLLIDAKSNSHNQKNKNAIFIKFTLLLGCNEIQNLLQILVSMSIYLSHAIILNCTFSNLKQSNLINKVIQLVSGKIEKIYPKNIISNKSKIHVIYQDQQEQNYVNKQNFNFYKIKNISNVKPIQITLNKIREKIVKRILTSTQLKDQYCLQSFFFKCELSSRIIQNYNQSNCSNKHSNESFSPDNLNKTQKLYEKQQRLQQNRNVRQKFEKFYSYSIDAKRNQFPLPHSLIKFKIQTFMKEQFKSELNQKVEKIAQEYEQKLLQKNQSQILKFLQKNLSQYIKQVFTSPNTSKQQQQNLTYHPQRIYSLIIQFKELIQQTHLFITQDHIKKYVNCSIYKQFYKKLYEQYTRVKRSTLSQNNQNSDQMTKLKQKIQFIDNQLKQLKQQKSIQQVLYENLKVQVQQNREKTKQINQKNIVQIQKAQNLQRQLQQKVVLNEQLKRQIQQFRKLYNNQKAKIIKQNSTLPISQSISSHQTMTNAFQLQLNSYKEKYFQIQKQLKQRQVLLNHKQEFYKQKIHLLQQNLSNMKQGISTNVRAMKNSQEQIKEQIQLMYTNKIMGIQKENKLSIQKYKEHINSLECINLQKNKQIQHLNQQIYQFKKNIIKSQRLVEQLNQKNQKQVQIIRDNQNAMLSKDRILQQIKVSLESKNYQNQFLNTKINEKTIRIQQLQNLINRDWPSMTKDCQDNTSNSYAKLQTAIQSTILSKRKETQSFNAQKNNQNGSTLKYRRISTQSDDFQSRQLQKLLQQRRIIQKKKQKCNEKQFILNKVELKLCHPKTQIKCTNQSSLAFDSKPYLNTQSRRVLQQFNKNLNPKQSHQDFIPKNYFYDSCRKKLF